MEHDQAHTEFDQLIERISYPTETPTLIDFMRQHGKGDDVVNIASQLENQTFKSPDEVRRVLEQVEENNSD